MRQKIRLTVQAISQIEETMRYIAEVLLEPGTAQNQIAALTDMPRD